MERYAGLHRRGFRLAGLGQRLVYEPNRGFAAFRELQGLVLKLDQGGLVHLLRGTLARVPRLRQAILFGSWAKGEARAGSDVDLLLVGALDDEDILPVVEDLENTLNREVQFLLYRVREFERLRRDDQSFVAEILKGHVIVLKGGGPVD